MMNRRTFIASSLTGAGLVLSNPNATAENAQPVPSYLADYRALWRSDKRAAALAWFKDAKFGLFMHYGLYSILGRHEWVQYKEKRNVAEVELQHV